MVAVVAERGRGKMQSRKEEKKSKGRKEEKGTGIRSRSRRARRGRDGMSDVGGNVMIRTVTVMRIDCDALIE